MRRKFIALFSWDTPTLALPIVGGGLIALGMNTYSFWWCVFLGIVPFFHFLLRAPSREKAFWGGVSFGAVVMAGAFAWGWGAFPLDWVGVPNPFLGFPLVFLLWVFEALIYGGIVGVASIIFFRLRSHTLRDFALFPALFVLSEWVSALSVSVIWWGPGTPIGPHWTLGSIGYALAESESLRSLAAIGGVYFLSFTAIIIGLSLYRVVTVGKTHFKESVLFFVITISITWSAGALIHSYYANSPSEKEIRVATTQTQFPADTSGDIAYAFSRFETLAALLLTINKDTKGDTPVNLVILPEDDRFVAALETVGEEERVEEILGEQNKDVTFATSGRTPSFGGIAMSSLRYLDLSGNTHATYEKNLLMPFGEYIPHWISLLVRLSGGGNWLEEFEYTRAYKVGTTRELGVLADGAKIGGTFCSEIVSPPIFKELVRGGAKLLFNSASHASLHGIHFIKITERHHAQIRATESNRFLVGATNFSSSFVISNTGNVLYYGPEGKTSVVIHPEVRLISRFSFYTKFGDWIVFASLFVVFALFATRLYTRNRQ